VDLSIRATGSPAPSAAAPVSTRRGRCGWRWIGTWIGCNAYSSATANCCDFQFLHEQHPDLIAVRMSPAAAPLLALLPRRGADNESGGDPNAQRVYLIDPLGNLMMSYAPDAKPKGMLEDMKRLLRLSQIG